MKTLFLPIGMQGSGKTTWARELCSKMNAKGSQNRIVMISRDNYRDMLAGSIENYNFGGVFSREVEDMITVMAKQQADLAVLKGLNIVIADMNLNSKTYNFWVNFAKNNNMKVQERNFYQEWLSTSGKDLDLFVAEERYLQEMVKRDLKRPNSIGPKVLTDTFNKYLRSDLEQHVHYDGLKEAYIFDLDGTLFHMSNRKPYEWKRCIEDTIDEHVASILRMYYASGKIIILMSGRSDVCKPETIESLKNNNIQYHHLFMRASTDHRKDSITKNDLFNDNVEGKFNVQAAFDDRDSIVELWRRKGIKCFQCEYGAF